MKLPKIFKSVTTLTVVAVLSISGCGGYNKGNQVRVSVAGTSQVLAPGQSETITAFVTGATDVSASFVCNFTTTANPTTAVPSPKPSSPATCDSASGAVGVLSNIQNTSTTVASTATFTAPATFPDQMKLPNVVVTITGTSKADSKKSGTFQIAFDSGIRIQVVPPTATLATGESKTFFAQNSTGTGFNNTDLKWDVTTDVMATSTSKSCAPGCGTVTTPDPKGAKYSAPAAVPTQPTVTLFATSKIDPSRRAQATITIVKAGKITFSGISPSVVAQGALQQDIFLAVSNATSQIGVALTGPSNVPPIDASQIKVIFPAGSSASSTGVRIRLGPPQLQVAGHYTVQVTGSAASFPLDIIPVRPSVVGSFPDNVQEAKLGPTSNVPFSIDGGFFGQASSTGQTSPVVTAQVNGQSFLATNLTPRRITGVVPNAIGGTVNAGLFPVSVKYSTTAGGPFAPPISSTAYTNVAVIPDYGGSNNAKLRSNTLDLGLKSQPSAIAVDSVLGFAVVTLAGVNDPPNKNVVFINLAGGKPTIATSASSQGILATGVAIDDQLLAGHVAAVVNYASRSLSVLSIPDGAVLGTVDLSNIIPPPVPANPSFVEPFPYSVGVDPFSHRALVAFASTNVGLIVNLDKDSKSVPPCILPGASNNPKLCAIGYVTLNTGVRPQAIFEPSAHLVYVSPGGGGLISAANLDNLSASVGITSATRVSNVVTVITSAPHNLNGGNPGSVLITGLPPGKANTNFNGSFSVTVLDATTFQYSQVDKDDSTTCTATCNASSGSPFLTYNISPSLTGIAINPITKKIALVDPNATSGQIVFIDTQSQSVSSITVSQGVPPGTGVGAAEIGANSVAFQPFTNTTVSFNSKLNQLSFLDPSALQRLQFLGTGQTAEAPASFIPPGTTAGPFLSGGLAVDADNNLALAVNSGSNNISIFDLGTIKPIHIQSVQTPAIDASTSAALELGASAKITLGTPPTALGGVQIFGTGFASASQVRLDGVSIGSFSIKNDHEIDLSIPVSVPDPTSPSGVLNILGGPRHFGLDVVNNAGVISNVVDFIVVEEVFLPDCSPTSVTHALPGGVAIDEAHDLALVANTAGSSCNQVSVFSLDPANVFSQSVKNIGVGAGPTGIAVLPRLSYTGQKVNTSGVAVVTNNTANTVSIIDPLNLKTLGDVSIKDVAVGTAPSGVAIDQETNLAVIANTGSNTVSTIDLTPLTASPIGKLTAATVAVDQNPIAVAIDPDRGTNGRGLAVVTALQTSSSTGILDVVDIGGATPVKNAASTAGLTAIPTGIVFDPAISPALFYATSSQGNQISAFNPDNGSAPGIKVGINPLSLAYNPQTGSILTVNSVKGIKSFTNTISIVDSQTFQTKQTLQIGSGPCQPAPAPCGSSALFSAAIHSRINLAVISDQANNRVLLFPLP